MELSMELTDELVDWNRRIENMLLSGMMLSKIAYWFLTGMCVIFFSIALYKLLRRRWSSFFLILVCASTFIWSLLSLLALYSTMQNVTDFLNSLRYVGMIPLPALLTMHIHSQVSYKQLRPISVVFYLIAPTFFIFVILRELLFPQVLSMLPLNTEGPWYLFSFYFYAAIALIHSYLLCFNVFYQMPPRARRSTRSTFVSVITLTFLFALSAMWGVSFENFATRSIILDLLFPLAAPIALTIFIYPLFDSMYIMPASDVIVTSREFIMKGMNTTVLVLNRRHQILDWNRRDWNRGFPLPKPVYKEAYPAYLKRVLSQAAGKVSPFNTDIFIMNVNGAEEHFMIRAHEVGSKQKMLGSVVEIAEVTPIYQKLRYFEEIAHIDTLTGLHNRNAYIDRISQILQPENMPLLVLVGDLNKLKQINDIHGHLAGDELIKSAAKSIKDVKPENSFLARVGGDEFVLLVPNGTAELAEKFISASISACGVIEDESTYTPSISWGYSLMTSTDQSYNEVFAQADSMMYEYKKNRAQFSSSGTLPAAQ